MDLKNILLNTIKTYDAIAEIYQKTFLDELSKKEFDRNLLDEVSNQLYNHYKLILDIGCGSAGHVGRYIHNKGFNVMGIDISPKSIELARKTNPNMNFEVMNMLSLEFADSTIQMILAFYSIIHIPKHELPNLFEEYYRVLEPGGLLILAVHEGSIEQIIDEMLGVKTTLFVSIFTEKELIEKLTQRNFKIEDSITRKPYDFEHQTNRTYIIARALKKLIK